MKHTVIVNLELICIKKYKRMPMLIFLNNVLNTGRMRDMKNFSGGILDEIVLAGMHSYS